MKSRSKKRAAPEVVFGPASLVRVPRQGESAKARAAAGRPVELKTTRLPRKALCPKCMQRPADSEVSVGVVTVKVCGDCAKPVEDGIELFKRGMNFIETLKRFL